VEVGERKGAFTNPRIRRLGDYQECRAFCFSAFSASPPEITLAPATNAPDARPVRS